MALSPLRRLPLSLAVANRHQRLPCSSEFTSWSSLARESASFCVMCTFTYVFPLCMFERESFRPQTEVVGAFQRRLQSEFLSCSTTTKTGKRERRRVHLTWPPYSCWTPTERKETNWGNSISSLPSGSTRASRKREQGREKKSFFFSFWQTFVISTTNKRSIVKEGWWAYHFTCNRI